LAEAAQRALKAPIRVVGLINSSHQAKKIIASDKAAMVVRARAFLSDPRWVWRAAHV